MRSLALALGVVISSVAMCLITSLRWVQTNKETTKKLNSENSAEQKKAFIHSDCKIDSIGFANRLVRIRFDITFYDE